MRLSLSKHFSALVLLISLSASAWAVDLEEAKDLKQLGTDHPDEVVVLMLSQPGCSFCVSVKNDYLKPLLKTDNAPPVRVLELTTNHQLIDFAGNASSAERLSTALDIHFTPTLAFVDGQGRILHEPIIGLTTPEFFGYYLDEAIRISRDALK